jgi:hypothetical protein
MKMPAQFEVISTGGGCLAHLWTAPSGWDVVITTSDGLSAAIDEVDWLVCIYRDRDWQPEGSLCWWAAEGKPFETALAEAIAMAEQGGAQ